MNAPLRLIVSAVGFFDLRTAAAGSEIEPLRSLARKLSIGACWHSGNGTAEFVVSEDDARILLDHLPTASATRPILKQIEELIRRRDEHAAHHEAGLSWAAQQSAGGRP